MRGAERQGGDSRIKDTSTVAGGSYLIDPAAHKSAGKTQKIYNKAKDKGAGGSEKDWLKKTGPRLPGV